MLPKKVKDMSAVDLKDENTALYSEIFNAGKAEGMTEVTASTSETIKNLETQIAEMKDQNTIREKAYKMGLPTKGEELIKNKVSLTEALSQLIDAKASGMTETNELKGLFQKTSPKSAGQGSEGDLDPVMTSDQAKKKIKEANPNLSKADIVKLARREYPKAFISHIAADAEGVEE